MTKNAQTRKDDLRTGMPDHDRVFAVMGFGGNGITFSMIAAQIVAAAIAGKPDPDAGLFAFR